MSKHNLEVVAYIEKELAKEIPLEKIKQVLIYVGHDIDVVEASIEHVFAKRKKRNFIFGFFVSLLSMGILLTIIGIFLNVF